MSNISITRGRTEVYTLNVGGISNWAGITATLTFAKQDKIKTPILKKTGSIDTSNNIVTFNLSFTDTILFTHSTVVWYEINIFKMDKSLMKTPLSGIASIHPVIVDDPTI